MNDLIFKKEEFVDAIEKLVPNYQKELVLNTLEQDEKYNYENVIKQLTGETTPIGMIRKTSAEKTNIDKSMSNEIKKEFYNFLCTKSSKYKLERSKSGITIENIITIISTALAADFSIAVGVITGAVTIFLMTILKIGKNAWCSLNQPS